MEKEFKSLLALGFGLADLTQKKLNQIMKNAMKKQGIDEKKAKKLTQELIRKSSRTKEAVQKLIFDEACGVFNKFGLATKKDIAKLKKQLARKKAKKKK